MVLVLREAVRLALFAELINACVGCCACALLALSLTANYYGLFLVLVRL
jgi:hypothetical protein